MFRQWIYRKFFAADVKAMMDVADMQAFFDGYRAGVSDTTRELTKFNR